MSLVDGVVSFGGGAVSFPEVQFVVSEAVQIV